MLSDPDYDKYQISASEALRTAGQFGLSRNERIDYFKEAQKWSRLAFLAANDNTYLRYLALCQYECASGSIMLVEAGFNSIVVSENPLNH